MKQNTLKEIRTTIAWLFGNGDFKNEEKALEKYNNSIKKINEAIDYSRCSTGLKDKETQDFYKWLKDNKYTRANSLIWQKNNEHYGEIGLFKIFKKNY